MEFRRAKRLVVALGGLVFSSAAAAATLYCCQDTNGKKVCADTLPRQCIGKTHTVKDERGTRVVEGMASPEQRAQREEDARRRKQDEEAQKEKRRQDMALLNTYASEKDIDLARERAEKDPLDQIKRAEAKIVETGKRRKKLEQEAEFYKNKPLPEALRRGLRDVEFEAKAEAELIEVKRKELDTLRAKYDADKQRYQELSRARLAPQ